jgi:hypothetical protein
MNILDHKCSDSFTAFSNPYLEFLSVREHSYLREKYWVLRSGRRVPHLPHAHRLPEDHNAS